MMKSSDLIICEAAEMASQLTSLMELLFERGTGGGLQVNDPLIGLAFNMATKVQFFLQQEVERQDKEENNDNPR